MIADQQRVEFMNKLVLSVRNPRGVLLSEWENDFIASFIRFPQVGFFSTLHGPSSGRQQAVDRMWMRYGGEINWPHPLDTVSERSRIDDADPNGCQYIVREDGRQSRCNAPATCREPGKLRYCATHGEAVQRDCKRANIRFCLIKFP